VYLTAFKSAILFTYEIPLSETSVFTVFIDWLVFCFVIKSWKVSQYFKAIWCFWNKLRWNSIRSFWAFFMVRCFLKILPHIFQLQTKAVRIITGSRPRDSCKELFKWLRILPLQSQYILSLLIFVVDNKNLFYVNSEIHSFITRQNYNLHQPQANLTLYLKGAYYSGIKVFNNLPPNIRNLFCDAKRFKSELTKYLHLKSFYTLEEYYNNCKS
jgi:hypothetical protein